MAGFTHPLANISYADLIRELGDTTEETIRWCQRHGMVKMGRYGSVEDRAVKEYRSGMVLFLTSPI